MKFQAYLRRVGRSVLQCAVRISPPDVKEWGDAILAELDHIEDSWGAFLWGWGGAAIIAKRTLVAWLFQNRNLADTDLREGTMRKVASLVAGSCVIAVLFFLFFPMFRQAVGISIAPWVRVFQSRQSQTNEESELIKLAKQAKAKQDAEAMAFVAIRCWNKDECVQLADEAVHLDPNLTWIYPVVARYNFHHTQKDQWVSKLEKWDPENAFPYLVAAQFAETRYFYEHGSYPKNDQMDDQWKALMASAFQSAKYDDYFSRRIELDRRVAQHYSWLNPLTILGDQRLYWGSYGTGYTSLYSDLLIKEGNKLEAAGNDNLAEQNYLSVVRFGQILRNHDHTWYHRQSFIGARIQIKAYEGLKSLAEKGNNQAESDLYASFIQGLKQEVENMEFAASPEEFYQWNSSIVQISGLFLAFFSIIILISLISILGNLVLSRSFSTAGNSVAPMWGLIGSVGLLLSSVALYVGYHPYAQTFEQFILHGDVRQTEYLSIYESLQTLPLGLQESYYRGTLPIYAWYGVTAVLLCTVSVWGLRIFMNRNRVATA